jgi:hypothetical protein
MSMAKPKREPPTYDGVLQGIVELLHAARSSAARAVNSIMTTTYWEVGRRIVELEQGGKARAGYGKELIEQLAVDLTSRFGRGFGRANLYQMRAFYLCWSSPQVGDKSRKKVQTASGESGAPRFPLPWSHYVTLLAVENDGARAFYEREALAGGWTIRQLSPLARLCTSCAIGRSGSGGSTGCPMPLRWQETLLAAAPPGWQSAHRARHRRSSPAASEQGERRTRRRCRWSCAW